VLAEEGARKGPMTWHSLRKEEGIGGTRDSGRTLRKDSLMSNPGGRRNSTGGKKKYDVYRKRKREKFTEEGVGQTGRPKKRWIGGTPEKGPKGIPKTTDLRHAGMEGGRERSLRRKTVGGQPRGRKKKKKHFRFEKKGEARFLLEPRKRRGTLTGGNSRRKA